MAATHLILQLSQNKQNENTATWEEIETLTLIVSYFKLQMKERGNFQNNMLIISETQRR